MCKGRKSNRTLPYAVVGKFEMCFKWKSIIKIECLLGLKVKHELERSDAAAKLEIADSRVRDAQAKVNK